MIRYYQLNDISFPKSTHTICRSAFKNSGLTELVVPDTIQAIEDEAFMGCKNLRKVELPVDISIGLNAFSNCDLLSDESGRIVMEGPSDEVCDAYVANAEGGSNKKKRRRK